MLSSENLILEKTSKFRRTQYGFVTQNKQLHVSTCHHQPGQDLQICIMFLNVLKATTAQL